jgi:hypothetical protein
MRSRPAPPAAPRWCRPSGGGARARARACLLCGAAPAHRRVCRGAAARPPCTLSRPPKMSSATPGPRSPLSQAPRRCPGRSARAAGRPARRAAPQYRRGRRRRPPPRRPAAAPRVIPCAPAFALPRARPPAPLPCLPRTVYQRPAPRRPPAPRPMNARCRPKGALCTARPRPTSARACSAVLSSVWAPRSPPCTLAPPRVPLPAPAPLTLFGCPAPAVPVRGQPPWRRPLVLPGAPLLYPSPSPSPLHSHRTQPFVVRLGPRHPWTTALTP